MPVKEFLRSLFQWQKKTISQKEAVKRYSPVIDEINEIQRKDLCLVSNNELREYSQKFKDEIRRELAKIDLEADEAKRQIKHLENAFSIPDALRMYKELEELQKKAAGRVAEGTRPAVAPGVCRVERGHPAV